MTLPDAKTIFQSFLERFYRGEEVDIESLCAEHAGIAVRLRALHAQWRQLEDVLAALAQYGSFNDRLRKHHGDGVNPTVSLDSESEASPGSHDPTSELLTRLGTRGLSESRYRFKGQVAKGGMGAILRVWDADLRRHLAMKVLLEDEGADAPPVSVPTSPNDKRLLARFLEEAQITGQLDHPGVVPVHELGIDAQGRVYFTMRLVHGRDLKAIFALVAAGEESWNQTRALSVMLRVCEAMAYAHSKGVIHRDLKPANIMVGRFGEVYVMDWGLARVMGRNDTHDLRIKPEASTTASRIETERELERSVTPDSPIVTMDGQVLGTPAYMPLEQARGELDQIGPRSDVYAVGAMLYHLLTEQMPYVPKGARVSPRTVLNAVLQAAPKPIHEINPQVPPELVAIAERAMARNASERYPDMLAMADDLRAYLEHRVVKAYETGALAEFRKWMQRNKGIAASLAAAILIALVGLAAIGLVQAAARRTADELRAQSDENAKTATAEAKRALSLSAIKRLQERRATADHDLWPRRSAKVRPMEDWLVHAREEVARIPQYEAYLAEVRALAPSDEQQWLAEKLSELITEVKSFQQSLIGEIEARLAIARTLAQKTIDEQMNAWNQAQHEIEQNPNYAGLELVPEEGLVPLEKDPGSGLWEFWVYETGARPERDRTTGKWVITGETGMVLVLLPGGAFSMGAQKEDPAKPNYDPGMVFNEGPVHEVELGPFFLSKYEMTQGQWLRVTGGNPSWRQHQREPLGAAHPVEQVTYFDCVEVLLHLGLGLPTEAQWEYAARAGTWTPWWTGEEKDSVKGNENIADLSYHTALPHVQRWEDWNDGYFDHAPVGSFAANEYGLYDVSGNVWEWCRDCYGPNSLPVSGEDGERQGVTERPCSRVFRGGSFNDPTEVVRSASRIQASPDNRNDTVGVRPARRLSPP